MRGPRILLIAVAFLAWGASTHGGNDPAKPPSHPLLVSLTSVTIEGGREYRALLVYPIAAENPDPAGVTPPATSGSAAKAKDLSVGEPDQSPGRSRLDLYNWSTHRILLLGGELLEGGVRDRFLARDVLLPPGKRVKAPVYPADRRKRKKADRKRTLEPAGAMVPDLLRLVGLAGGSLSSVDEFLRDEFALAGASDDRQALGSLLATPRLAPRIAEYRTIFEAIPDEAGKRIVGAAVFAGDRLLGIDLFGTNASFRASWPKLLHTAAFQATLYEAAYGLLKQPFAAGRDPDRRKPGLRKFLKKAYAARQRKEKALGLGDETVFTRQDLVGRVLVADGRVVHALLLVDYLNRPAAGPPPGGPGAEVTPGELERRAERGRLTEYEKRLLERMRRRRQGTGSGGGALRPPAPEDVTPPSGSGGD